MSYSTKPDTQQPHFDSSDMLMMHDMFRREFALMPGLAGGVAAGDRDRAQIVSEHIEAVSTVLHHHHIGEDENIWPLLLDRCADLAPLVRLMEDQHQQVATLIHEVDEALSIWRDNVTVESRAALADALDRLIPPLKEHLSAEQDRVVPLMEQYITDAEWNKMVEKESAHVNPEQLPLWFGMLMYEGDRDSIERAILTAPADTRPAIRQLAAQTFAAHSQRLHGTATPPRSTEL